MAHWADELHAIFLDLTGAMNRPEADARFLELTGVKLDRALFPLLSRLGAAGPLGVVELAGRVGRDHSTVSRQIAKLERLGLVERTLDPEDQRVRLIAPSAAGRLMLAQFAKTRRRAMEAHFSDWSQEDRATLVKLLGRMTGRINRAIDEET